MKKFFSALLIILTIALPISCISYIGVTAILAGKYVENEETTFISSDENGYEYLCHSLVGQGNGISIAWSNSNSSKTPDHLILPSSLTYKDNNYIVKCISYGGFANCTFTKVDIPSSVDEIKPEAFMCCVNLTEIIIPPEITIIQSSTFMDCRLLETVKYAHENNVEDSTNEKITIIEDNAFASCYKLKNFTIPKSILEIGQCAFENCNTLSVMFLPKNEITIHSYAFSKCTNMTAIHVPNEVKCIENFAFTQCNNLVVYLEGNNAQPESFGEYYANLYSGAADGKVKIQTNIPSVASDANYPGLIYSITINGNIISEQGNKKWKENYSYATLIDYNRDETTDVDNFMKNQILTLPDYVHDDVTNADYPLAVLGANCFNGHTELKGIIHNKHLVRIYYSAYGGCTNIEQLNYSSCTELKEIGWNQFYDEVNSKTDGNNKISELILPNSLEVLRSQAFKNLRNVSKLSFYTDENQDSCLNDIPASCFEGLGYNASSTFELELPCSLNNALAGRYNDNNSKCAIANNAFRNARSIKSVRMLECKYDKHGKTNDSSSDISFGDGAFSGCSNLTKFVGSSQLKKFSNNVFSSSGLQNIFLNLSRNTSSPFNWGSNFLGSGRVVVYLDQEPNDKSWLNPNNDYLRESTANDTNPTDVENASNQCPYYVLGSGDLESKITYYNNDTIATIQENNGTTITQYFGSGGSLDLTSLNTPTDIKKIGRNAFGGKSLTEVIIPDTIEEIGERAFFSNYDTKGSLSSNVLKVFTYKKSGVKQNDINNQNEYCRLPASCTKVGAFAFFNNAFSSVTTDATKTTFDLSSFYTMPKITSDVSNCSVSSKINYFDTTNFKIDNTTWLNNNSLYYVENGVYIGYISSIQNLLSGEITLEEGTKYIGAEAILGTKITSLTIPSSLTTIYSFGVAANPSLKTIKGDFSNLKYISASHLDSGDSEAWNSTHPIRNNPNYNNGSHRGSFQRNLALEEFDFTKLTNIYEIGQNAFMGDKKLTSATQQEYRYYNSTSTTPNNTLTSGVLDLRNSTKLHYLGANAFNGCDSIKYIHLPDTTGNDISLESNLMLNKSTIFPNNTVLLVGERAIQASSLIPNVSGETAYNTATHYPPEAMNNLNCYYYAEKKSDLSDKDKNIQYWTYGKTKQDFILFSSRSEAESALPN